MVVANIVKASNCGKIEVCSGDIGDGHGVVGGGTKNGRAYAEWA